MTFVLPHTRPAVTPLADATSGLVGTEGSGFVFGHCSFVIIPPWDAKVAG